MEDQVDWQRREEQWSKQIRLFKNTEAYRRYRVAISDEERRGHEHQYPVTPRLSRKEKVQWTPSNPVISLRSGRKKGFQGMMSKWKRLIYQWNSNDDIFIPHQIGKATFLEKSQLFRKKLTKKRANGVLGGVFLRAGSSSNFFLKSAQSA